MDKENQIIRSVWGNKYIRDLIFFYLNLYNNNSNYYSFTIEKLNNYVYKNYLFDVSLNRGGSHLEAGDLPSSIRYLEFFGSYNPILQENSLPDSLISVIFNRRFNQQLNNKIIKNGESFQQPILPNQLPEGLIFLYLDNTYQSTIIYGSIPNSVQNLRYTVESFSKTKVPVSTTNLEVRANVDIKVGMIPHNVTNIKFGDSFICRIEQFALPPSIRSISFGDSFNKELVGNILLSNIEYIKLGKSFQSRIDIPSTVKTLKLTTNYNDNFGSPLSGDPYHFFFYVTNLNECYSLTNLELGRRDNPNLEKIIFPNSLSLTTLNLGGYKGNQLSKIPSSVTNLNLGYYYNFPIEENSLPKNLKSLNFGESFDKPINSNLLPKTLRIIYFQCPTFNQNIYELPNQLPLLKTIYLSSKNISFINTLDTSFYSKYIRVTDEQ
ncbi:hypothetical protein DDB_G0275465 [Dictyostelium discoideum AX4]|uniref:FNIP repeat-containing protein n=1 Tax=Dictyostelium discoideum TaxID=44689 RepID=Q75K13_DICDI|nr:hypothetical protein DDB_G0275465 [Dictyostelium discoideum AX4]EAL69483.1 hypothetical protein DDB_G0275465 [Dictyostelium discoideum AX4]|eukprot:XP_643645.1 hypothetical protein DDB_G0275465 [Dictyostelium discoideum AX4]